MTVTGFFFHSMTRNPMRLFSFHFFLTFIVALLFSACSDTTNQNNPISIKITQPVEHQIVSDSLLRIMTEVASSCSCRTHVEFYVNHELKYSDFLPYYAYDWNIKGLSGAYVISARVVVDGEADEWDSVHVSINP
jgi:hypothetical protein